MLKINELEFRQTESLHSDPKTYYEIVKWDKSELDERYYCFTLASWSKDREGWNLNFIGSRPFKFGAEFGDIDAFWNLAAFGQKYLDALFDLTECYPDVEYGNYYQDKVKK